MLSIKGIYFVSFFFSPQDKAQLLEIAKANAAAMCAKAGVPLPPSLKPVLSQSTLGDEKVTQRTYGTTIQELTEVSVLRNLYGLLCSCFYMIIA